MRLKKETKPEKYCPECNNEILWKSITSELGAPLYQGHCPNCNIVFRGRENPEIAKGKELAKNLIGVNCLDKRITKHSGNTQIGILRAMQHCATCGKPTYLIAGKWKPGEKEKNKCHCRNCNCVYCTERKRKINI